VEGLEVEHHRLAAEAFESLDRAFEVGPRAAEIELGQIAIFRHSEAKSLRTIARREADACRVGPRVRIARIRGCSELGDLGRALGHGEAALARIRGPVGLNIEAVTAPEIALSIIAEIVAVPPHTRRRAVFKIAKRDGAVAIGFHARGTHDIVDMIECLVLTPRLFALVGRLQSKSALAGLVTYVIDGDTVVAGALKATVNGNAGQGAVYVFVKPRRGWRSETEAAKLTASDGAAGDALGWSVAVSGKTVVAGAPFASVNGNSGRGAAYVFAKPNDGWRSETESAKLTASDGAASDSLGWSL